MKNWPCLLLCDSRDRLQPPPHPSGTKWTLNKHYIFMQLYQIWLTLCIHTKITLTTVWATCYSLPLVQDSDSVLGVWVCLRDLLPALFISFALFHILSCLFIDCDDEQQRTELRGENQIKYWSYWTSIDLIPGLTSWSLTLSNLSLPGRVCRALQSAGKVVVHKMQSALLYD